MTAPDDDLPLSPSDQLLARYREANALDSAVPSPALRAAVLAQAKALASQRTAAAGDVPGAPQNTAPNPNKANAKHISSSQPTANPRRTEAANDRRWLITGTASVAVLVMTSLLVLQLGRDNQHGGTRVQGQTAAPTIRAAPAPSVPPRSPTTPPAAPIAPPTAFPQSASRPPPVARTAPARQRGEQTEDQSQFSLRGIESHEQRQPVVRPAQNSAQPPQTGLAKAAPSARQQPTADGIAAPAPSPLSTQPNRVAPSVAAQAASPAKTSTPALTPAQRLLAAVATNQNEAARQALQAGAPPDTTNATGQTPLMLAAAHGNAPLVRLLLAAGADARHADPDGLTAAAHARRNGHEALARQIEAAAQAGER